MRDKICADERTCLYLYNMLCREQRNHTFSDSLITMESSSFSSSLFSSPFAILLTTLVTIGVLKVIAYLYHQHRYWKKRDVPQIRAIPSMKMGWKMLLRHISFTEFNLFIYNHVSDAKYIGLWDMATPLVLLRDPELIKDVMVKDFEHFPDHKGFASEEVDPLFASKMKVMFELVSKCSYEFAEYLADHPELCSSIDTKESFRRYTTDVIATSAFGISVNSMKDRDNEFFIRGLEISKFSGFKATLKFIFLRACPRLAKVLGLSFFSPATSQFFKKIVAETIRVREEQSIVRPDMIHLLMRARDKEGPSMHEMTLDDIVAQALIFFLAGFDTSATLMCFVVHELAVHRDIQDRLWEEIEAHFADGNGEITYEAMSKMVYMDMVVSEALRKYPPVVFIDRLCAKKYELPPAKPGYKSVVVERDCMTWTPVYALHHDPKYFPNPSKFNPERFSNENKDKIVPYTYLPFGLGPRKCIGNRFALMETKLLLAYLLHRFIFKTTEKTVDPIVFDKKQFTLQPDGGFWIALEKRQK
ncbi:cytochrome P450 9e2-like [Harpegnathos saltator]|uniref:cytochrome P450 9e2-like n=1 Tax=Harpegnathos saltator TaxID=610380 RepID=UPI000DBEDED3|nr:cytochrome P450 9e2-like [Harpegnathos saltator]